eukprot:739096-Prorocentrum_lima.AAC.1
MGLIEFDFVYLEKQIEDAAQNSVEHVEQAEKDLEELHSCLGSFVAYKIHEQRREQLRAAAVPNQ